MLCCAVAAEIVCSDPYDIYGPLLWKRYTIHMTAIRLSKPFVVRSLNPSAVIVGTSRAEIGYRAEHGAFTGWRPYNLGTDDATIYEMRRLFEHALATSKIDVALVGLDYESFVTDIKTRPGFNEGVLATRTDGRRNRLWFTWPMRLALSFDSLWQQYTATKFPRIELTTSGGLDPALVMRLVPQLSSVRILKKFLNYRATLANPAAQHYALDSSGRLLTLTELDKLIGMAMSRHVALHIVINPIHSMMREAYAQVGALQAWTRWKRDIQELCDKYKREGYADLQLWDYATINAATTEPLAALDDVSLAQADRNFMEVSHFTPRLGDMVLDDMLVSHRPVSGLGAQLDSGTLDQHLRQDANRMQQWEQQNPKIVEQIGLWVREQPANPGNTVQTNEAPFHAD